MKKLLEIICQGENQTVEFKRSFQKEVIESVVAFANAKGGQIFLGIDDSGDIIGVNLNPESVQNWINQIKQNTSPAVIPDVEVIKLDNKEVVVIDVKEYPIKPVSCKNRYLMRKHNSNHIMSMEEIADEYLKTKNSSWDYYIDDRQSLSGICIEKVERFIEMVESNFNQSWV